MKSTLIILFLGFSPLLRAQSDSTIFAPTTYTEFSGNNNVIYCSSVELLWRELRDYLVVPLVNSEVPDIGRLNSVTSNYDVPLSEAFWFTRVGLVKDGIIDSIQATYKKRFGQSWTPDEVYDKEDLVGHAYLQKDIEFYSSSNNNTGYFRFNDSIHARYFSEHGWANPLYNNRLMVHDFQNEDDFIVQIGCKDSLDEVYFAKVHPQENLKTTYETVMNRVNANRITCIGVYDELRIPYLQFDVKNDFQQFREINLVEDRIRKIELEKLTQRIKFDLNQDGIKLRSEAGSIVILGVEDEEMEPRIYAFDQPFLIILKRKGELNPYFLMWVQNTQFMEARK